MIRNEFVYVLSRLCSGLAGIFVDLGTDFKGVGPRRWTEFPIQEIPSTKSGYFGRNFPTTGFRPVF